MKYLFALAIAFSVTCASVSHSQWHRSERPPEGTPMVTANTETLAVNSRDDAADDMCVWIHPEKPESSVIIGTDKNAESGGLYGFYLDGKKKFFESDPSLNNVDVRYGFHLGEETVDIVAASRRNDSSISIFTVVPEGLRRVGSQKTTTCEPYGFCLGKDLQTQSMYAFLTTKKGPVEQWELFAEKDSVRGKLVRTLSVPSQTEGCVVDDAAGYVYVGEEANGIWRFGLSPEGDSAGLLIAKTGTGELVPDVEGVSIYHTGKGNGYLLASSQGNSTFAVYALEESYPYLFSFAVKSTETIDNVSGTDGIDVSSCPLGDQYPLGIFIAQDDANPGSTQNFKIVDWRKIMQVSNGQLEESSGACVAR